MATDYNKAKQELDAILNSLMTEKRMKQNDRKLIAVNLATEKHKKLKQEDPEAFFDKRSHISKTVFSKPEIRENHKQAIAKRDANPKYKENVKNARKREAQSEEGRLRRSMQQQKFIQTKEGQEQIRRASIRQSAKAKPLICPFGIFRSVSILSQHILDNKLFPKNSNKMAVGHKIRKLIRDDPANYYYISIEEYIMLVGKDPFDGKTLNH